MNAASLVKSRLFRPPYGRITPAQIHVLKKDYTLVMWDILTRDYEKNLDAEKALKTIFRKIRPGSLVVFHDSEKSEKNLRLMLPQLLEHFSAKGYSFKCL
jgi:peptidoglycan/xylan/chitin deacetylase (PgdA/CDA1 family)